METSTVGEGIAYLIRTHALHCEHISKREIVAGDEGINPI